MKRKMLCYDTSLVWAAEDLFWMVVMQVSSEKVSEMPICAHSGFAGSEV